MVNLLFLENVAFALRAVKWDIGKNLELSNISQSRQTIQ
jgi:hypothetical protein